MILRRGRKTTGLGAGDHLRGALCAILMLFPAAEGGSAPHQGGLPDASPLPPGKTDPPIQVVAKGRDDRGYDCEHVRLELVLDFGARRLRGEVRHAIAATRLLETLDLDFTDSLHVLRVRLGGREALFRHEGRKLLIEMDPPLPPGAREEVRISYAGRPPRDGLLGFSFQSRDGVPAAYTLSEPSSASSWWPCKDVPDDKVTAEIVLTVPDTLYAGSNGLLVSDEADDAVEGRRIMTWREDYPIAPYLISVACTNYEPFTDTYRSADGRTLPLLYLPYPEHREAAERSWGRIPLMLAAFEERFGPYPFHGEKYGMAEFSWGGAMENQTLTSYGEYLVDGTDANDWVVAHELAHQWWGNMVTLASWEHMWLNEGFARYSEALWYESQSGGEAYREWIRSMWRPPEWFPGALVPPDYIFNATVYLKGAWVLHMLRGVLGDRLFFQGLRSWGESHAFANATTEDLVSLFQEVSNRDLGWFFDRWVYGTGMPAYDLFWSLAAGDSWPILELRVEQIQPEPPFSMPIEIEIQDSERTYRVSIQDSLRSQTFRIPVRLAPAAIRFDPDDWILKELRMVVGPASIAGAGETRVRLAPWPSPGRPPFTIPLGACPAGSLIEVLDPLSRRVWSLRNPGVQEVLWDGRDDEGRLVSPGIYFVRRPAGDTRGRGRICVIR